MLLREIRHAIRSLWRANGFAAVGVLCLALGIGINTTIFRLIVGQGLALTATGVVIGLVLAAFGTPLARSLLYNVCPFDPFSFVAVSLLLIGVALAAGYVPARRAMNVDPVVALRQD